MTTEKRENIGTDLSDYIRIENLKVYFGDEKRGKVLRAVDDVTFTIKKNEFFGLVGESGCGKSTLGRAMINLTPIRGGDVFFDEYNMTAKKKKLTAQETLVRNSAHMVFQNPFSSLNPRKTVRRQLSEVLRVHKMYPGQEMKRVQEMLAFVGIGKESMGKFPGQFSGGQLQRIAIARALLLEPQFVVADEPVSALDVSVQAQILNLFSELKEKLDLTMLFISHNLSVVEYISDRVGVMYVGKIVEIADVKELYEHTGHPYTRSLINSIPSPETGKEEAFYDSVLEGEMPNPMEEQKGCRFASRCKSKFDRCDTEIPQLLPLMDNPDHLVACHLCKHG